MNSKLLSLEGYKTWSVAEEGKLPEGVRAIVTCVHVPVTVHRGACSAGFPMFS